MTAIKIAVAENNERLKQDAMERYQHEQVDNKQYQEWIMQQQQ